MNNYDRAFDLIGISRGGGGFGLSGGASGEAPYDPYRMWYDKGNIDENSSIGVSQQLKKQGQIAAKTREEYEREQRKQWDEAHKNEKSGSFTDAEKQKRDADVKEAMKDYDASKKKQKEAYKRFRPDLSSAEAANERRSKERKETAKQQNEDAALAAAHSYLEGIDDGHGEPDLSSGGTPPPKKKQSASGDTNKVAKEALEKTASPKETSAAEIKRPVIVEPDNLELKVGEELLTYEKTGAHYSFCAYNEDEFLQVEIPPPPTMPWSMLFGYEYEGDYSWIESRSKIPWGVMCVGCNMPGMAGEATEYEPCFAAPGTAGLVLTSQGPEATPLFLPASVSVSNITSIHEGDYILNFTEGTSSPVEINQWLSNWMWVNGYDDGLDVVTPEDLVMYNDADIKCGIGYAFYAYDDENFGQTTIPPPSDSQGQMLFGADQSTNPGEWATETPTPGSLMFINYDYSAPAWIPAPLASGNVLKTVGGTGDPVFDYLYVQELLSTGGSGSFIVNVDVDGSVSLTEHTEEGELPSSVRKWDLLFGADQSTNPGEWSAWYASTYGLMWFDYDAASGSYNPALIGQAASGKALVSTGFNTAPAFRYLYGRDIFDISSYTGDSLPEGSQGDILYNDGSDWQPKTPFLNSVLCFEKNSSSPEPIFLYNDYNSSYNIHKYLHFSGVDATPSVDQIDVDHLITTVYGNYGTELGDTRCLLSVNQYGEITLTPYAYAGMPISNLMDPSRSSCEILLQLDGDGKATAKRIVDPSGTLDGDYIMKMTVTAGARTFEWVTYGE